MLFRSKKGNAKESSNYHTIALISHASKVMLKSLQARHQQYKNRELPNGRRLQGAWRRAECTAEGTIDPEQLGGTRRVGGLLGVLNIWKFTIHLLLNFEHHFTSV